LWTGSTYPPKKFLTDENWETYSCAEWNRYHKNGIVSTGRPKLKAKEPFSDVTAIPKELFKN